MGSQNKKRRKNSEYGSRGASHGSGHCKNTPAGYDGSKMKVIPRSKRAKNAEASR